MPLTRWSLAELAEYLRGQGVSVSAAHLGRILARAELSFQRSKSWKGSPDPEDEARFARVLALYRQRPGDGVVISFDVGPVSLCPHQGHGWARRRHGVRYLVGALDLHAGYLRARLRPHRNGASTLAFMRQIRLAYPRSKRIYWVQDDLSCHWTPAIRTWAEHNNVELVPTPTYASYLNRIESHVGAIEECVCKNADYLDWDAYGLAMAAHLRHRNSPEAQAERRAQAEQRQRRQAEGESRESLRLAA